jgi:MSHA pilin protein MshA
MMKQGGFTLIELVMVLILVSILSITALPRFINLKDEATAAAVSGLAAQITSGSQQNYLGIQLSGVFSYLSTPYKVSPANTASACSSHIAGPAGLIGGSLPTTIIIASEANCSGGAQSAGQAAECRIRSATNSTISAVAYITCTG